MSFEPQYNGVTYTEELGVKKEQVGVFCKSDVASESVERIISVTASSCVSPENRGENAGFNGKTVFCVFYSDSEGALKKYECGKEFSGVFSDAAGAEIKALCCKTEKIEADLSGITLSVSAVVTVSATASEKKEISYLSGGEDVIVNGSEKEIIKNFGEVTGVYPVIEEFELDYPVKEVLSHKATVIPTAVQCGVGTVIIDGEAVVTSIVLPNSENSGIIKETKVLPIRLEVEYEDAMPTFEADAAIFVKSFKTDVTVDETNGKSAVELSLNVFYEVKASVTESISVAEDTFSTTELLRCEKDGFSFAKNCGVRTEKQKVSLRANLSPLGENDRIVTVYNDAAEPVTVKKESDGLKITGSYSAEVFIENDGKYRTEKVETPFSVVVPEFDFDGDVLLKVYPAESSVRQITADEIEINSELVLALSLKKTERIDYIKSVASEGEKKGETAGISVYIAVNGEDLWSLSKRLNVCPDELTENNKELKFPLTGEERIVVYRKR